MARYAHDDYMKQYGDKLEIIGTIYNNARIGLVVLRRHYPFNRRAEWKPEEVFG